MSDAGVVGTGDHSTRSQVMRAVWLGRSGGPEVLTILDVPRPTPTDHEVLVRIEVATVTRGDVALRRTPAILWPLLRVGMGLRRKRILGHEFAGIVEAVGRGVTSFVPGNAVLGTTTGLEFGSHAEYVSVPDNGPLVAMPPNVTFEEAAALPVGAMTALRLMRAAKVGDGTRTLIYGASGSVGSAAVQLATHLGAVVTAVTSTANIELVRSLGPNTVIDYTAGRRLEPDASYDVIVDAVGRMARSWRAGLKAGGVFVSVKAIGREQREDLVLLRDLLALGAIRPVIDRRYPLDEIREATRYVEAGHKRGNVVVTISS